MTTNDSPWQDGWKAGYLYARDGTMNKVPNPYSGDKAVEWEDGYSQGLDTATWLGSNEKPD